MACNHLRSHRISNSLTSLFNNPISTVHIYRVTLPSRCSAHGPIRSAPRSLCASIFSWDDVIRIAQPQNVSNDCSDLEGFFEKINICNRGSEMQPEFLPFVIQDQVIGFIHNGFARHLRRFQDVFVSVQDNSNGCHLGGHITLHSVLKSPEDRTAAVGDVVKCLGEAIIPGIRNELFPVTPSFGKPIFFSLERAAVAYFGIKPHGIACGENLIKECEEEAGIPRSISSKAIPVGAVSYMDIDGFRYKRDVLFCYDLKLPEGFIPKNQDGEVESFKLIPVTDVVNVIRRREYFKPNCALVIIDFLVRHGYITPEDFGYLELLKSLRSGDCS